MTPRLPGVKSVLSTKSATRNKVAKAVLPALTFVPTGPGNGRPVPDMQERLAAFYAKYPESRRTLRKGQGGTIELVKQARGRR